MALVNVVNMAVLDNPANFLHPFQFEITFECLQELDDDLEWKVIYVRKAEDMTRDLVLDEILVGPVPVGVNKFVLQADAPSVTVLPQEELLGVTVVLVTCSYREREFVRVGYYVNNEYTEEYDEEQGPPKPLDMTRVMRTILADKPRVTKFPIPWGDENTSQIGVEESQETKEVGSPKEESFDGVDESQGEDGEFVQGQTGGGLQQTEVPTE